MEEISSSQGLARVDAATEPEEWVDRHGDVLYRYALLRIRTPDLAADIVQETFLEALRARGSFAGHSSERTWLIGILRHKIGDHFRRVRREPIVDADRGGSADGGDPRFDRRGHWRAGLSDWGSEPSRVLESREFWAVFRGCLSQLPEGLADTFFLRELDGMRAEEVQKTLCISPSNLWKRLHRARSLLQQCLETRWFHPLTKR